MKFNIVHASVIMLTVCFAGIVLFPGATLIIGICMCVLFAGKTQEDLDEVTPDPSAMLFGVGFIGIIGSIVRLAVKYIW